MIAGYEARRAARGTKRTCQDCEQRFYDLTRLPAVCPMCGVEQPELAPVVRFDPTTPPPRGIKWREPARPKPVPVEAVEPDVEEAVEADADAVEDDATEDDGAAGAIVDEGFLEEVTDDTDVAAVIVDDDSRSDA